MLENSSPSMTKQAREQKGSYVDLSEQAQQKLVELVQRTDDCFTGDRRETAIAKIDDVRQIKISLARIIRRHVDFTVNHRQIWIDRDVRSGIHIYVFRHQATSRKSFAREHAHYYVDTDGALKLCHGYRKSRWKTHRPAMASS